MVVTHSYIKHKPDVQGYAAVHIFRFQNSQIAEMWGIAQEIPQESPNELGMF